MLTKVFRRIDFGTRMPSVLVFSFALSSAIGLSIAAAEEQQDAKYDFFETRIRPVLVEQCYECHNSSGAAEGDFALDHRQPLMRGGVGGQAIIPGDPANSRMMKILRHEIAGLEMPEGGEKLSDSVIADFEKWIADGAFDPRDDPPSDDELQQSTSWEAVREKRKAWWSFQPITDREIPSAITNSSSSHPIDRFIDARLFQEDVPAASIASNDVLVRRLYYALVGLPPTFRELADWTNQLDSASGDRSDVYENLVDQLLASPRFGERWARHWMDWIRYAESHGSEGDPRIDNAWVYRDYLIRAMNQDIPADRLIREHLAGDLLEDPRMNSTEGINESLIGPAHLRMVFHGFAPTDALDERVRFTDDQINAVSKAFLGLTLSCARCHDHKFDPISQADYYAWYGIFTSCRPGRTVIEDSQQWMAAIEEMLRIKTDLRKLLAGHWQQELSRLNIDQLDDHFPNETDQLRWPDIVQGDFEFFWNLADPETYADWYREGDGLSKMPDAPGNFRLFEDGSEVIREIMPGGVLANTVSTKLAARLSSPDISLPQDKQLELWILARGGGASAVRYVVQDYPRNGTVYPVRELSSDWTWHKFDLSYWAGDSIHVELTTAKDSPLLVKDQDSSWFDVRYCIVAEKGTFSPPPLVKQTRTVLGSIFNERDGQGLSNARSALKSLVSRWAEDSIGDQDAVLLDQMVKSGILKNDSSGDQRLTELVNRFRKLQTSLPVPIRVPALEETVATDQPLFIRGNHKQPGNLIPRRFLEIVDSTPYETAQSGRLELAEDLLRDDNPLTKRVMVNRIWLHLFGQGIVATPDNFGRVGDKPSHPELLDWLALKFQKDNWSIKSLIRLIVTSQAWQRDSAGDPGARTVDPENRLLSHQNVRRLDAEAIRDTLFCLSGRLQQTIGGQPVDGDRPRRSVYVNVIRNDLDPFLRTFDFPEPFSTVGRRNVTNVPAQSLTLMNDPLVREIAEDLASRSFSESNANSDRERVRWMMRQTLQREVNDQEVSLAQSHLEETRQQLSESQKVFEDLTRRSKQKQTALEQLSDQVKQRVLAEAAVAEDSQRIPVPQPAFDWDFESANGLHLYQGAEVKDGQLRLNGGYALTDPINRDLAAKTLEVVVQLDTLEQRGGGAITVQSLNGIKFDAIVFGERDPRQWLAGSNNFSRTQSFTGAEETEAISAPVHFAIVYDADGTITGYRNGQVYGKPYNSNGPLLFKGKQTSVGFGIRHLPAGGNRQLSGTIMRAGLYDRALSSEEVRNVARSSGPFITEEQIEIAMNDQERERRDALENDLMHLESELSRLGPDVRGASKLAAWTELAHALFTLKEFIYVR